MDKGAWKMYNLEIVVIALLAQNPNGLSFKEIVSIVGANGTTIGRTGAFMAMNRLEARTLVEIAFQVAAPNGGQATQYYKLTPAGLELYEELRTLFVPAVKFRQQLSA